MIPRILAIAVVAVVPLQAQEIGDFARAHADGSYAVDFVPIPEGVALEVGGMDFLADGSLVVGTRRGQVWIVENPADADFSRTRLRLFCDGLHEALGVTVVAGDRIVVTQRTELSELIDDDGDGRCDIVRRIGAWPASGNYHEFAFGAPRADDGGHFVALNLGFFTPYWYLGVAEVPWRGWVLKVMPDGEVVPWASGFRSPNGVSLLGGDRLVVTDNQGDWLPVCPVHVVVRDAHHGHPASLDWRPDWQRAGRRHDAYEPDDRVPRRPAALWLPYDLSRSTGNVIEDTTGGAFGPFGGQGFAAELTNGRVIRVLLDEVDGVWQGASLGFVDGVGAANRIAFGPDGTLYCGLTSRGWGGEGAAHGISRVRRVAGVRPAAIHDVALTADGFDVTFTAPLDVPLDAGAVRAERYHYKFWWKYGSDETDRRALDVVAVETSADRRSLSIRLAGLEAGANVRVVFDGATIGGRALQWPRFDYTVNTLPGSGGRTVPVARAVPAPQTREQKAAYGVFVSDLWNTFRTWSGEGWKLGSDPKLDRADVTRLAFGDSNHYLHSPDGTSAALTTTHVFGACTIRGEVMFATGGRFGLVLPNGDEVTIEVGRLAPGSWHEFTCRYAVDGARARVAALTVGGEDRGTVELEAPAKTGPIGVRDPSGRKVTFKNVTVRPIDGLLPADARSLPLSSQVATGWRLGDGGLVTTGTRPLLVSDALPAGGAVDVGVRAMLAPKAAAVLRIGADARGAGGIAVVLNRSMPGQPKTGSIVGGAALRESLIAYDDTEFAVRVSVDADGVATVRVNGVPAARAEGVALAGQDLVLEPLGADARIDVFEIAVAPAPGR